MELTFDRLTKEYGAKIAVDRVSAAMYSMKSSAVNSG